MITARLREQSSAKSDIADQDWWFYMGQIIP
jgi:hypothetical protein